MKIRPVILCGGSGSRLWPNQNHHQPKQFIDFGNWNLFGRTLERIKSPIFDYPIISTNKNYITDIKKNLKLKGFNKYKIVLEPAKRNTSSAILSSVLIKEIPENQSLIFLTSDHIIGKTNIFNKSIKHYQKYLTDKNIFIFGIKPGMPSDQFGYLITKKDTKNLNKVIKFIEKPKLFIAKKIIKKGGYWNSGMFFLRKESIINNFKKLQKNIYQNTSLAVKKSIIKKNIYYLNKREFNKNSNKSFDHAILEKINKINAIKLNLPWSDLGSWKEILLMFHRNRAKYFNKKNTFYRPWGRYTNLYNGKNFLIKELYVKPKGVLSLQKHFHRSEHWVVTQGTPKITLNKKKFVLKPNETIFIPVKSIHRIENPYKKPVKIIEAQLGSILKETDIVRYQDIYGRVK